MRLTKITNTHDPLKSFNVPSRFGLVGFSIVLIAYVMAVVNFFLPSPIAFIQSTLQPLIFVGIASLLYHIGQHLHALHANVVRMFLMEETQKEGEHDELT